MAKIKAWYNHIVRHSTHTTEATSDEEALTIMKVKLGKEVPLLGLV